MLFFQDKFALLRGKILREHRGCRMTKTIFISGATSGFGMACAELFAGHGWRLIICGRRQDRLDHLKNRLRSGEVYASELDVRDRRQIEEFVADLAPEFQNVDVLVNNAGLALGLEPADTANLDDWETMIDTNIKGLCYLTRTILPHMVQRGSGHIINIGSVAGNWPYPGGNVYGATKAFVRQFSHNLRADLLGKQIRVTNIEPGLADTEFSTVRFRGDREKANEVYRGTQPLTGSDIAAIVHWVASVPSHININSLEVMPVCQSWAPFAIHREKSS